MRLYLATHRYNSEAVAVIRAANRSDAEATLQIYIGPIAEWKVTAIRMDAAPGMVHLSAPPSFINP